jgi:tyrosine-protein kinase Etk/Wzc
MVPRSGDVPPPNADGVDVVQILATLRRHRRRLLTVAAITFGLAVGWTLLSRMRFDSTARMYLGELEDKAGAPGPGGEAIDLSGGGHSDIGSEVEILKSRSMVTRAVLASGLNATIAPSGWTPPRYWRWLLDRRSPELLDVAAPEIAVVNASLSDRSLRSAKFDVHFVTNIEYEVSDHGRLVGGGKLGEPVHAGGLSITLLPGIERGPASGAKYWLEVASVDDVVDSALKDLEVTTPTKGGREDTTKVTTLQFSDSSPRKAASFLKQLMLGYLDERQEWKTANASAAETFMTTQLAKTRETLDDIQNRLAQYRANNHVVVLDNEAKAMIEQIGKYEEQRVAARLEVESLAAVQQQLKGPRPPVEAFMLGEAKDDSVLTGLATTLAQSQQKLTQAETRFNAPAPEVRELREQVDGQLQGIRSYVNARLTRQRDNLHTLDGIIGQYEDKLRTVPSAEVGLAKLTREADVYSTMYSSLLKRQQETALVKASTISKNRILDPADVPYREQMRGLILALVSGPLGLAFGALVVLLRGALSGRLQHRGDVQRYLGQTPIFATIPPMKHKKKGIPSESIEAFRTLRAQIDRACRRHRGNVVLVTSPSRADGKTTCAYLLASVLAKSGRSVLLVETGAGFEAIRKLDEPEQEVQSRGLGDVLVRGGDWREITREVALLPECTFQVIRRGSEESADMLSAPSMCQFIADTRALYDFVLFDAPSYPAVSDTLVLSSFADCVISVLRLEHTSRASAVESVRHLSATAAAYGLVLNDTRPS